MDTMNLSKILVLSPHTDDAEFGAGGTIARFIEEGKEIFYAAFSIAEKSVPKDLPKNILDSECRQATKALGISENNLFIYKFPVRDFPKFRQEILEILISLRDKLHPALVLLPSLKDIHQDHHTIAEEGVRAFKYISILSYEVPINLFSFETSSFVILQKEHLDKKTEAIKCYQSQKHRHYSNEEFIYGMARARGVQAYTEYAEAFEVIRWIIR